jgi:hypothetical protein
MKNYMKVLLAAGALTFAPMAASANSITFQGVTFTLTDGGGTATTRTLDLEITNADNPTGDWLSPNKINFLQAFALKPDDNTYGAASATNGFLTVLGQVNNGMTTDGCASNPNNGFFCFHAPSGSPFAITHVMDFAITFTGGDGGLINIAHMQVCWWASNPQTNCTGSLMSKDIIVPGPVVGAGLPGMIFACGGLLGLARHRRRQRIAA